MNSLVKVSIVAPFSCLAHEVYVWIYQYLDFIDLCRSAVICKNWNALSDERRNWEKVFQARWSREEHLKSSRWRYIPTIHKTMKMQFRDRLITQQHWATGRPNIITMAGHKGTVTCLKYDNERLLSGSDDGSLIRWQLNTGTPEATRKLVCFHN